MAHLFLTTTTHFDNEIAQETSYDVSWACNIFFPPTSPLALPCSKHEMEGFFFSWSAVNPLKHTSLYTWGLTILSSYLTYNINVLRVLHVLHILKCTLNLDKSLIEYIDALHLALHALCALDALGLQSKSYGKWSKTVRHYKMHSKTCKIFFNFLMEGSTRCLAVKRE